METSKRMKRHRSLSRERDAKSLIPLFRIALQGAIRRARFCDPRIDRMFRGARAAAGATPFPSAPRGVRQRARRWSLIAGRSPGPGLPYNRRPICVLLTIKMLGKPRCCEAAFACFCFRASSRTRLAGRQIAAAK
jgi:hypothetical protein